MASIPNKSLLITDHLTNEWEWTIMDYLNTKLVHFQIPTVPDVSGIQMVELV